MHRAVVADGGLAVLRALAAGLDMGHVVADADASRRHDAPNRGGGGGVRQVGVMRGAQGAGPAVPPGRVLARAVAHEREGPRLVQRDPGTRTITDAPRHEPGVLAEPFHDIGLQPAAAILDRLRQVPVVERDPRLDARAPAARRPAGRRSRGRRRWRAPSRPAGRVATRC